MTTPILIFDIETIPDIVTGRRLYPSLQELSDDDALSALIALRQAEAGNSFMRQPLHKIACLSFLWVDNDTFHLKSLSLETHREDEILTTFFRAFNKTPAPILVSYNGSGFDLPVMMYRSLHHGLSAPKLFNQNKYGYLNRYSDTHIDLMEKLSLYHGQNRQKLDVMSALCGFAGKGDIDGSMVVPMVQNEQWQKLTTYCESDVINTWFIYLRYQHLIGKLDSQALDYLYHRTLDYLSTLINSDGSCRHQSFLTALDTNSPNTNDTSG